MGVSIEMDDQAGPSGSGASGGASGGDVSLASLLMSGGFAVYPLPWCPHLETLTSAWPESVSVRAPCADCGDTRENWLCLHCNTILCSRYVNSHGLQHSNNTDHVMALSFSDLSVWCYCCDNYVDNEKLYNIKNAAHRDKFGEEMMKVVASEGTVDIRMI